MLDYLLMMQLFIVEDQVILQNDLAKLAEWEQLWGMEFQPQKGSYLQISRSRKPKTYKYILKGVTLAKETSTKYIGVDIQSNLAWNNHFDRVTKKWNPHQKKYEQKIELAQRRAARFTLNRYHTTSSVTSMLHELSWETLKSRRIKLQLTDLYNIQHNLIDVEASKYLTKRSTTVRSKHSS